MKSRTYYEILGVSRDASIEEITIAKNALAKVYHPDANAHKDIDTTAFMQEILEAYQTLSDPEKRKGYDVQLFGNPEPVERVFKTFKLEPEEKTAESVSFVTYWNAYSSLNEILEKSLNLAPWFRDEKHITKTIIDESSSQLLIDLSYYYAEVVIRNYNGAKWSYFTNGRSYIDVNQPLISISDTNYRFRPYLMLLKFAMNSDDKNTLYNAFLKIDKLIIEYSD